VSDLPDGWEFSPLGEVVHVLDGRRIPVNATERASRPGPVPYYGAAGQVGWIDEALFDEPLVLLGEDGVQFLDRGKPKAYSITGPAWVNNHAHVLRTRDGVLNQRFLVHYLNWIDYSGLANGTTRLKLTQAAMRRIVVRLPPCDEQQRIVDVLEGHLSCLDAARDYLRAAQRRTASMQATALGDLVASARREGVPSVLGAVARWGSGGTPKSGDPRYYSDGSIPWAVIGDLTDGPVTLTATSITPAGLAESAAKIVPANSVLIAMYGSIGKLGLPAVPMATNQAIAFAMPHSEIERDFLFWYLRAERPSLIAAGRGGTQKNISQTILKSWPIFVPPVEVQRRLTSRMQALHERSVQLQVATSRVLLQERGLRRALLDAAFSGRLTRHSPSSGVVDVAAEMAP
jgi:type I restriction enzyme S subunit